MLAVTLWLLHEVAVRTLQVSYRNTVRICSSLNGVGVGMVTGHRVNSNVVASGRNEERDVSSRRFLSGKASEGSRHALILILASLGWMGS